jgi:hypothetical protein
MASPNIISHLLQSGRVPMSLHLTKHVVPFNWVLKPAIWSATTITKPAWALASAAPTSQIASSPSTS